MRSLYRVNAVKDAERISVINDVRTLNEVMHFVREDGQAIRLREEGYTLQVFRDQPSLVHEVRP